MFGLVIPLLGPSPFSFSPKVPQHFKLFYISQVFLLGLLFYFICGSPSSFLFCKLPSPLKEKKKKKNHIFPFFFFYLNFFGGCFYSIRRIRTSSSSSYYHKRRNLFLHHLRLLHTNIQICFQYKTLVLCTSFVISYFPCV